MYTVDFEYDFGDFVEDTITGYRGIVITRADYKNYKSYGLLSKELSKVRPDEWVWMEEARLKLVS